jgi:hypothetical protein
MKRLPSLSTPSKKSCVLPVLKKSKPNSNRHRPESVRLPLAPAMIRELIDLSSQIVSAIHLAASHQKTQPDNI